ncbi:MAG: hypothetical protein HJJLKODD_02439 [Phycisphaerae bacterium]|nr:hypothetical protein [Phycisphaerae bacterium]
MLRQVRYGFIVALILFLSTQSGCRVDFKATASDVVSGMVTSVFANFVAGVVNGAVPVPE